METPPITPEMLHLIAQLDEAKGQRQALKTLAPERLLALRHSATIESIAADFAIQTLRCKSKMFGPCSMVAEAEPCPAHIFYASPSRIIEL